MSLSTVCVTASGQAKFGIRLVFLPTVVVLVESAGVHKPSVLRPSPLHCRPGSRRLRQMREISVVEMLHEGTQVVSDRRRGS